jgi:hypothetical protein
MALRDFERCCFFLIAMTVVSGLEELYCGRGIWSCKGMKFEN